MNSPLADIGAELREARESQKRSLDDLAQATLIHVRHLQAVEDGRDADLPEPFYVKAFIRKYANALGLPGDAMANRYWDTRPLPPMPPRSASGPDILVPWWVFPAMLGALLLGALGTFAVMNANRGPAVSASPVAAPVWEPATAGATFSVVAQATAGQEVPGTASAAAHLGGTPGSWAAFPATAGARAARPSLAISPAATASPGPISLPPLVVPDREIAFRTTNKEAAWMQIVADGHEVHTGVVPKGSTRTWQAMRSLVVRIGKPAAVTAHLGDRPLGSLGPKDSPVFKRTFLTRAGARELAEAAQPAPTRAPAPPTGRPMPPTPVTPEATPTPSEQTESPAPSDSATDSLD